MYEKIQAKECIGQAWNGKKKHVLSPNISNCIMFTNQVPPIFRFSLRVPLISQTFYSFLFPSFSFLLPLPFSLVPGWPRKSWTARIFECGLRLSSTLWLWASGVWKWTISIQPPPFMPPLNPVQSIGSRKHGSSSTLTRKTSNFPSCMSRCAPSSAQRETTPTTASICTPSTHL